MTERETAEQPLLIPTREQITDTRDELYGELARNIAGQIREYSASQAPIWRQLPFLAIMSDGKTGYGAESLFLYKYGLWRVAGTAESGALSDYVDCDNGNIIHVSRLDQIDFDNFTSDERLFSIWGNGDRFDADSLLEKYQHRAVAPAPDYMDADREREWHRRRERIIGQVGLRTVFQRVQATTAA